MYVVRYRATVRVRQCAAASVHQQEGATVEVVCIAFSALGSRRARSPDVKLPLMSSVMFRQVRRSLIDTFFASISPDSSCAAPRV